MRHPDRSANVDSAPDPAFPSISIPASAATGWVAAGASANAWLERLLELESAKTEALMAFDADRYESSALEQSRLVDSGVPDLATLPRDRARAFAMKARLNSALLLNLFSISPHFALAVQAYGPNGATADSGRVVENLRVEA